MCGLFSDICHCLYFVWKKRMVFWSQQYYSIFFIWPQCHVLFLGKTRSFWCHLQPSRTPIPPMWVLVGRLLKLKKPPNRIQSPCSLANVMNDGWVGAILSEMRSTFYRVLGFFPLLFGGGGGKRSIIGRLLKISFSHYLTDSKEVRGMLLHFPCGEIAKTPQETPKEKQLKHVTWGNLWCERNSGKCRRCQRPQIKSSTRKCNVLQGTVCILLISL